MKVTILKNETSEDHLGWIEACKKFSDINFSVLDLTKNEWLNHIQTEKPELLLARPPGLVGYYKGMYDERHYILKKVFGYNIYPTLEECMVYENKRMLSYILQSKGIKHPETQIFYHKDEAQVFAETCDYPIVGKTAIGAGGSGVQIIKSKSALLKYVDQAFGDGLTRTWGPNMRKGDTLNRLKKRFLNIPETIRHFKKKRERSTTDPQRGYVLLQEYIPSDHEWRCVAIGDSYFGHKKLRTHGEMMSGTSAVSWDLPPERLLNFVEDVMNKTGYYTQAVDVFESKHGDYYVNELQAFWGSKNPHQMLNKGTPGRFVKNENNWIFEEGEFNTNNSYDLRLKHAIELYKKGKL